MTDRNGRSVTFERTLGVWHLVLFGLAFTAPLVVLMTFGILDSNG